MIFNNHFKRYERIAFMLLLILTLLVTAIGIWSLFQRLPNCSKWLGTGGLLATVTGVVQLEVSGLFARVIEHYSDEEKYPYGPPSYVTREIIDHPDRPLLMWMRNMCFFNLGTGFWLIVVGTLTQVLAVWV